MRLLVALLMLGACAAGERRSTATDMWPALQRDVVAVVSGARTCGRVSLQLGFCRSDARETPSVGEAALADGCRGQPAAYLAAAGQSAAHRNDRRAAAAALEQLFRSSLFSSRLEGLSDAMLLKTVHDRDQALRFFRPQIAAHSPDIVENSRWVAICAHALFARRIVGRFLTRTTPEALARDEELANHAWLLVQHSDFDPAYQLRMSEWFGAVDVPHMRRHSAYLHDRAMVGLGRAQRFGTQLRCHEGVREPFPVADRAGMDARRIALGLKPMDEHLRAFARPCPPPQPGG